MAVVAVIAVLSLTSIARAADISGSLTYPHSGATVGTSIPASTTIAAFSPGTALVAGDEIVMTFPSGTALSVSNTVVSDFLIVQSATGTSAAGDDTAPSGVAIDEGAGTITLTIATGSLSWDGDSDGLGTVTVATSTSAAGNEITHRTAATTTGTFGVRTTDIDSFTKDTGTFSNVTFVAGPYDAATSTVATSAAEVVYGSTTTVSLTARDQYSNPILDLVVGDVSFALVGGTSAGSFAPTWNSGSGVYSAWFTSTAVGTASTLTATHNSGTNAVLGGSPTITVTARALTVTGVTASNKVYNANTTAALSGSGTLVGVIGDDEVTLGGDAAGTFDTADVGTGKTVTVSGLTLGGTDAGNYTLTQPGPFNANITPKPLEITGVSAGFVLDKIYDGTTLATLHGGAWPQVDGVEDDDVVTLESSAAAFPNKNAGSDLTVTVTGILGGADVANYTLTPLVIENAASITQRAISATVTVDNKVYDSTNTATILTRTANGVFDGDTVTVTGGTATFASTDVADGITVNVSGLALDGVDAGNYVLNPASTTADITQATLTVTGVTAANKVYDSNTTATVDASGAVFVGVLGGDTATVGGTATGSFGDADVGTDKMVTVAGITATGTHSLNYAVTQPTTMADITAAASAPTRTPTPTPTLTPTLTPTDGPTVTREDEQTTPPVQQDMPAVVQTQATNGSTATANALPPGSTLTAATVGNLEELTSQAPLPGGTDVALAFVIEARDADGNAITEDFAEPVELEFNVPASSVPAGATSDTLVLAFWNGSSWTEVEGTVTVNADGSLTINASVDHFTIFAVQHQPDRGLLMPPPTFVQTSSVWGGGGYALLDAAVGEDNTAWVLGANGFHGYTVGVPDFVNANFRATFPSGLPPYTVVTVTRWDLMEEAFPADETASTPPASPADNATDDTSDGGQATWTVRAGDTLGKIGVETGAPWQEIAAANGIAGPGYVITIGQVLTIPSS